MFNATLLGFGRRIRQAVLLLGACGMACSAASCERRTYTRDFSTLSTATRIEVTINGLRHLSTVTDPARIKAAAAFINQYKQGWKKMRLQGAAIPKRRFDFWDGDRYIGEYGIHPDFLTADGLYQEAPAEEIAKIAALFELKWPPQD